jgi:arginyl-tRNA synthetase
MNFNFNAKAGLKKFLQKDQSTASTVHALSLSELLQIYVKAVQEKEKDDIFFRDALACSAALESGETEAIEVWKSIREKTIDHLTSFWNTFGIHYDVVQGESEFAVQSKHTDGALNLLKTANNLEIGDDQRTLVVLPADDRFSKPMKVPLVKSDGSSLYLLRDIACCLARSEKFKYEIFDKFSQHTSRSIY